VLIESFGSKEKSMDAPVLSDGTLRVLATGATLLSAPPGSLVIVEEIDNGVHPSRAELLIKQIIKIGKKRKLKVLLTSHNPALLDALPDDSLGDVLCCYRDPEFGDSRIVRLGDLDRFPELMAQGTLGELVTKQVLDRFLKDKTTQEERKQEALSWLNDFKKGVSDECHLFD
jgi:predicted ATPase